MQAGGALLRPELLASAAVVALASSVIPYSLELEALRRLPPRIFGVLMSLEPAVAALAGLVVLGQTLDARQIAAIGLVVAASAGAALGSPVEPLARGDVMLGVLARGLLVAKLPQQAEALGHDVVLVDRLEVLLACVREVSVREEVQPLDHSAHHLAHAVLDEARTAVGLLHDGGLVGALHQLVDLR